MWTEIKPAIMRMKPGITIIPWGMYMTYGDIGSLENQYRSMKSWVDFTRSKAKGHLWNTGFHFGDWRFYRPDDDNDGRAAVTRIST